MTLFSIRAQEVRAGSFTLRFGAHDDESGTVYLQISGKTEGHQLVFNRDGEVLSIKPIRVEGELHAENKLAPAALNEQSRKEHEVRREHNSTVEQDGKIPPTVATDAPDNATSVDIDKPAA